MHKASAKNSPKLRPDANITALDIRERIQETLKLLLLVQLASDADTTDEGQAISNGIHRVYNELWDLNSELQNAGDLQ